MLIEVREYGLVLRFPIWADYRNYLIGFVLGDPASSIYQSPLKRISIS